MLVLALSAASGWLGSATRPVSPVQRAAVLRRTSAVVLSTPDVKAQLLASCEEFKAAQEAQWAEEAAAGVPDSKTPLQAESIANIDVTGASTKLSSLRNATVDLIDQLAQSNPTPAPFAGFREAGGGNKLSGSWKLLFTTGADATVRPSKDKGTATVYQVLRQPPAAARQPPPAAGRHPPPTAPSAQRGRAAPFLSSDAARVALVPSPSSPKSPAGDRRRQGLLRELRRLRCSRRQAARAASSIAAVSTGPGPFPGGAPQTAALSAAT